MTDATADAPAEDEGTPKKKGSKLPMLIGLVLALAGGGGGFYAAWSGLLPFGGGNAPAEGAQGEGAQGDADGHGGDPALPLPDADVAFLELEPLVISMGTIAELHHLHLAPGLHSGHFSIHGFTTDWPRSGRQAQVPGDHRRHARMLAEAARRIGRWPRRARCAVSPWCATCSCGHGDASEA